MQLLKRHNTLLETSHSQSKPINNVKNLEIQQDKRDYGAKSDLFTGPNTLEKGSYNNKLSWPAL